MYRSSYIDSIICGASVDWRSRTEPKLISRSITDLELPRPNHHQLSEFSDSEPNASEGLNNGCAALVKENRQQKIEKLKLKASAGKLKLKASAGKTLNCGPL